MRFIRGFYAWVMVPTAACVYITMMAFYGVRCASVPLEVPKSGAACIFKIANRGGELVALYEPARIVGEVAGRDEWWIDLPARERLYGVDGTPRAWNWPKSRVLIAGEHRIVSNVVCRCPQW